MSGDLKVQTHQTASHSTYLTPTKLITPFARLLGSHVCGMKLIVPDACAIQSHGRKGQTHASFKTTAKTD